MGYTDGYLNQIPASEVEEYIEEYGEKPRVTEEGFRVRGENSSDFIRALVTLDGIDISTYESWMRPRRFSNAGFLGRNESLLERLIIDNDKVRVLVGVDGNRLAHEDLLRTAAEMIALAEKYRLPDQVAVPYKRTDGMYEVGAVRWMGVQESPFIQGSAPQLPDYPRNASNYFRAMSSTDHWVKNMQNGAYCSFPGLAPALIAFGFYEGNTSYRFDPQELAESTGLVAIPENDPVVQSMQDPNSIVRIRNLNQLRRMQQMHSADKLLVSDIWEIVPGDISTLLEVMQTSLGKSNNNLILTRQLDFSGLKPSSVALSQHRGYLDSGINRSILINTLPQLMKSYPEMGDQVLNAISELTFPRQENGISRFVEDALYKCIEILNRSSQSQSSKYWDKELNQPLPMQYIREYARRLGIIDQPEIFIDEKSIQRFNEQSPYFKSLLLKIHDKPTLRNILEKIRRKRI
jgi:hypothetical protein